MTSTYWLGIVFALVVLIALFLRMRNSRMKERYATWWIIIAVGTVVFSLWPGVLTWMARITGVVVPLNLGFFLAGIMLLLLSLRFSVDLSQVSEDKRTLVEEIAILRHDVDRLQAQLDALEARDSSREAAQHTDTSGDADA